MTAVTPLHDGQIRNIGDYVSQESRRTSRELSSEIVRLLISHYGSAYSGVLDHLGRSTGSHETVSDVSSVIGAEVRYAIKEEMAQKLADVVFRRTTLGQAGNLTETSLRLAAAIMARELAWSEETMIGELEEVRTALPHIVFEKEKAA
jgi:glycerol-3-phosphate dehydrogenase